MDANPKPAALNLEVEVLEAQCRPGCGSSTTRLLCTCPVSDSTLAKMAHTPKS